VGSPLATAVRDYSALASSLLEHWSEHASSVASKLDEGTYDADTAAADLAVTATLAAESGLRLAFGALDALATLTGRQCEPHVVRSDAFDTKLSGATLELVGPLVNGLGSDSLPASVIQIEPSVLDPLETEFRLRTDATGRRAGAYAGAVEASTAGQSESVPVWIIVP
jgi:hypothetical protein